MILYSSLRRSRMNHYTNILILRSNNYSKKWHGILDGLNSDILPLIVLDEKSDNVNYGNIKTLIFSKNIVEDLKLTHTNDMQWRFGDYCLYIVNDFLSKNNITFDYLWMVEPDVLVTEEFSELIKVFSENDTDFLCSYLDKATSDWMWYKYKKDFSNSIIYRTFFPLIRVSARTVDFLYNSRVNNPTLANDEVFVATTISNNNFKTSCFNSSSKIVYDRNSFSYMLPHYVPFVELYRKKATIYHPAFDDFSLYLSHLKRRGSWKHVIKNIFGKKNKD